jgi:hypothetical protein
MYRRGGSEYWTRRILRCGVVWVRVVWREEENDAGFLAGGAGGVMIDADSSKVDVLSVESRPALHEVSRDLAVVLMLVNSAQGRLALTSHTLPLPWSSISCSSGSG